MLVLVTMIKHLLVVRTIKMKKLILLMVILLIPIVYSANWVDDPADCEQVYNSVSCGALRVCGITGSDTPSVSYTHLTLPTILLV